MAKYVSDPKVVAKWDAARAKHAEYKSKVLSAKTAEDKNKYQKLVTESLKECTKWYDRL